jgi:hypothetical protein
MALGDRNEDQHAGAALSVLQAMRRELTQRLLVRACTLHLARYDAMAHAVRVSR